VQRHQRQRSSRFVKLHKQNTSIFEKKAKDIPKGGIKMFLLFT
jgi:hypothetical protein